MYIKINSNIIGSLLCYSRRPFC